MKLKNEFPESFYAEEEKIFRVASETKKLWAVLLDLLLEFDRVCKKHGIKYMIDGGTLLGAMRHGGFIPWDDDIDIVILREEYEKLQKVAKDEFMHPYFFQTYATDKGYPRNFARLRNSETTAIQRFEIHNGRPLFAYNQGAFIDIFIEDNVPADVETRNQFLDSIYVLHEKIWGYRKIKILLKGFNPLRVVRILCRYAKPLMMQYIFGKDPFFEYCSKIDFLCQKFNVEKTEYVSHLGFCANRRDKLCLMVPRMFFEELTTVSFEGFQFPATAYANEYLEMIYGNWRKYVVGVNCHGGCIFDPDKSYKEYLKEAGWRM